MDHGRDFNDIKGHDEKKGGRRRVENSFDDFRSFISEMEMGDIKFKGDTYTWANNREGEGFIQKRLDRFFGSWAWMLQHDSAVVTHVKRQASDHSLLVLDSNLGRIKTRARFFIESRGIKDPEIEEFVWEVWSQQVWGTVMFRLQQKLKRCKVKCIEWRKRRKLNFREEIELIQKEMESMQELGGESNWPRGNQLNILLEQAYKCEKEFWSKKSRLT